MPAAVALTRAPLQVLSLLGGDAPPKPPCAVQLRGVLMFADISGYSRITRWMASRFEEGPWATSQVLNKVSGGVKKRAQPQSRTVARRHRRASAARKRPTNAHAPHARA